MHPDPDCPGVDSDLRTRLAAAEDKLKRCTCDYEIVTLPTGIVIHRGELRCAIQQKIQVHNQITEALLTQLEAAETALAAAEAEHTRAMVLLNPVSKDETLLGAIKNVLQAEMSAVENATEAIRQWENMQAALAVAGKMATGLANGRDRFYLEVLAARFHEAMGKVK